MSEINKYNENDKNYTVHCKLTKIEYENLRAVAMKDCRTVSGAIKKVLKEVYKI